MAKLTRIAYPKEHFRENTLPNLQRLVERKAPLLKQALGVKELPIIVRKREIILPWFPANVTKRDYALYEDFVFCLVETAWEKHRFIGQPREEYDHPRREMNRWIYKGLGMEGEEYAAVRALMCKNLPMRRRGPKPKWMQANNR